MRRFLVIPALLAFLLSGCEFTTQMFYQVPIEFGGSETEKIVIAQRVINLVEPGLKQRTSSNFPNVSIQQLDTLTLSWGSETSVGLTGSDTLVFIQIDLQYTGTFEEADAILQYCANEIGTALGLASAAILLEESSPASPSD